MKRVENVPAMTPTSRAKAKPRMTSPPSRRSDTMTISVRPDVRMVRLRVWLRLSLTTDGKSSHRRLRMFSRTRSKMTIVSFRE